jgi:uncharacterized low-complexity protein
MSNSNKKPVAIAIGAALVGGLALSGSAFAMQPLAQGYMLASAGDKAVTEGNCGANKAGMEGKCGANKAGMEGKCGGKMFERMDSNKDGMVSRAECRAHHDAEFDRRDTNKDGNISRAEADAAMKAKHEGKCGADKKAGMEGKCGEGKCGGSV